MIANFTQEDLIRFLYGECDPMESKLIENALELNWDLSQQYLELLSSKKLLDSVQFDPAQSSVDLILKHSRNTSALEV